MYDVSLVIHTNHKATESDIQAIVRAHSPIDAYVFDTHPDVSLIIPIEGKLSISIDQVHALHSSLHLSPVRASHKVIVFSPAEALTLPAQQSLLKMVEEPPSRALFLLVTHAPSRLLPTILSRCTVISHSVEKRESTTRFVRPRTHADAIRIADEYGTKKEIGIAYIEGVLAAEKETTVIKAAVKALNLLNKNINAKLVLDDFLFQLLSKGNTK